MGDSKETSSADCKICKQFVIPEDWRGRAWGKGPHAGVGICSCESGKDFPVLKKGDILIDRNYTAGFAAITTYGYRGENIMTVQRVDEHGHPVVIWHRREK